MALDYVKFQRGTPTDYNTLLTRNQVEDNTLYFLYEQGATTGSLYLGKILIGNVGAGTSITNLSDLSDVLLENVGATDILVYSSDGKWKNASLNEIANLIADQQGLGFEIDSKTFQFQTIDGVKNLKLLGFDTAADGAMPFKKVDGTLAWSTNNIDTLAQKVNDLDQLLQQTDTKIAQQIAAANHLTYKTVTSLDQATETNVVYLLQKSTPSGDNTYDEFMLINGALEQVGNWAVDLSNYATVGSLNELKNTFNSTVGDLTSLNNLTEGESTTVVNELNKLYNLINSNPDKVGDLTQLITYEEGRETTIVDELNILNQRLMWQPITITE